MKTKVHRGSWIVTVPLAAASIAYIMLVFLPGRRAIGEARDQIEQKQDYITRAAGLPALRAAQQALEKTQAYNTTWEEHAPAQGRLSALYGRIHALAEAAGTTTTRFDPEPLVSYDNLLQIPLVVGCTGSFAQVCEFLRGLEGLQATIWMESVDLEHLVGVGESITCELNLVVFVDNPEISDYAKHSE